MLERIAGLLERDGGRVLAAYALLITAGLWAFGHLPKADDVITAALTLVARELVSSHGKGPNAG